MNDEIDGPRVGPRDPPSERRVHHVLVEAADATLPADVCEFIEERNGHLFVEARSATRPDGPPPPAALRDELLWNAYSAGRSYVVDDLHDTRGAAAAPASSPSNAFRSLCCVPVDGEGLLVAKSVRPAAFGAADRAVAERLAELAETALGRAPEPTPAPNGGTADGRDLALRLEEIRDILSHDLKNPLMVAYGNLELARESGDPEYLDGAEAALEQVEALVEEVVILAETGELASRTETVDLRERADAAWKTVNPTEGTLDVAGSVAFAASHRGVCRLLENLIENAVTHGGPDVTVRIGALDDGFFVEDDGAGVPDEHRDRLFERGFSLDSGQTGLGLHIVRRIAEAHGWEVGVGDTPAGGVRFEITGVQVREG